MAVAIPPKISKIVDAAVSFGAALVIWGALQKILHAPNADFWLKLGLGTEAVIFLLYGILYAYYPSLAENGHNEEQLVSGRVGVQKKAGPIAAMDQALMDADVTPDTLKRLGDNFKKLNDTIQNMNNISDVVAATGDYTAKTREVTSSLDKVKEAYTKAALSVDSFSAAADGAKSFQDQVVVMNKNLGSLNAIYELELKESDNQLKALNSYYKKLTDLSGALSNSAEDAKKVQDQIGTLANNLGKLNGIYGNMLTAMQGRN